MFDEHIDRIVADIADTQQSSGAYPASPNFANYRYTWFRDGSFIADGMSRAGQVESAERFFAWGAKVITDRRDLILSGGKLDARYTYEGQESHEEWANFQLDGFGIFLWALKGHEERHDRSIEDYKEAAGLLQHYLASHWQEPAFDWWEERLGVHAASLACIYAGLKAYAHPEADVVKQAIDLSEERVDASLIVCALFDAVDQETFAPVLQKIEQELVEYGSNTTDDDSGEGGNSSGGGVHRYKDDTYFGGGEWPVLSAMLGWYYLTIGKVDDARLHLGWCILQTGENGWIPEQSTAHLLHPEEYQPWVERAGEPANPLLWSQAMTVTLSTVLQ